jgi:hypothetical protein
VLDLGFSDAVLVVHTPVPAWRNARHALSPGSVWRTTVVSWVDFIQTYGDLDYFQRTWGKHSFLSERDSPEAKEAVGVAESREGD